MNLKTQMMYETSKGIFGSLAEAEKKENRQKIDDPQDQDYGKREPIKVIWVLVNEMGHLFKLQRI